MAAVVNEGNCWFYGPSATRASMAEDLSKLQDGATTLRPGETVIRVDGGAVIYVMPDEWFELARADLDTTHRAMAAGQARIELLQTALHHNVCALPGGATWEAHTFGNLMGGGRFLAGPAVGDIKALSGKKLANVRGAFGLDGVCRLTSWEVRV